MSEEIKGYYTKHKHRILREFDRTTVLMAESLIVGYGEEFAPYSCMSDIALSDALGWGLIRTQTLADGLPYCDFRFKKGAATQISSKTAEVQQTVEKISRKEAEKSTSKDG